MNNLIKTAIFYDGNYFAHASNYYFYEHPLEARLSVQGLHNFIRTTIAQEENLQTKHCKIIDAQYFRGRFSAYDYTENQKRRLLSERIFDEVLTSAGIVSHYISCRQGEDPQTELHLSMEAIELARLKQYDWLVLIAGSRDYIILARKLHAMGISVMLLSWSFEYMDKKHDRLRKTGASIELQQEVSSCIDMIEVVEEGEFNEILFLKPESDKTIHAQPLPMTEEGEQDVFQSQVLSIKEGGYGFIHYPPHNLYFHQSWMSSPNDFLKLNEGVRVLFQIGKNKEGKEVAVHVRLWEEENKDQ